MNIAEAFSLAVQHHESGRLREAEDLYRQILQAEGNHPDALHLLGVLTHQAGQTATALGLIQKAINHNSQNPHYHTNLGNVLRTLGRPDEAIAAYQRAIRLKPDFVLAHTNLGVVLQELGRVEEAVGAYRCAIDIQPNYADAHYNLGTACKDLGRLDDAVTALRRTNELNPESVKTHVVLAGYLLEQGDPAAALHACDNCLRLDPTNRRALAFKTVALDQVGRRDEYDHLLNFDRLMTQVHVSTPPSFANLAEFNAALGQHIRTHPSLITEPSSGATRLGSHTEELLVEPKGPFSILEEIINTAVEDYLRSLPADQAHPYLTRSLSQWRLSVWGVVLRERGHQVPHVHPDGWVSGVYYVKLPRIVETSKPGHAGWIEFGHPPAEFHHAATPDVKAIRPEEGLMILFPSYFYHRTVPFAGTEERISVAFDVLPRS